MDTMLWMILKSWIIYLKWWLFKKRPQTEVFLDYVVV